MPPPPPQHVYIHTQRPSQRPLIQTVLLPLRDASVVDSVVLFQQREDRRTQVQLVSQVSSSLSSWGWVGLPRPWCPHHCPRPNFVDVVSVVVVCHTKRRLLSWGLSPVPHNGATEERALSKPSNYPNELTWAKVFVSGSD